MLPVHSALTLVGPPSVWQQRNVTTAQRMGSLPPKGEAQQLHKVGNIEEETNIFGKESFVKT